MNVLLVDDDAMVLKTLDMVFSLFGFQTEHASNGTSAWVLVDDHAFDLIVTDVNMPGGDGFELLRRLRENPATSLVPVIMISGQNKPASRRQALAKGANDYLAKPFDLNHLRTVVASVCKISSGAQTAVESAVESTERIPR